MTQYDQRLPKASAEVFLVSLDTHFHTQVAFETFKTVSQNVRLFSTKLPIRLM